MPRAVAPADPAAPLLTIGIVCYRPRMALLRQTVESLATSVSRAAENGLLRSEAVRLYLIDNGGSDRTAFRTSAAFSVDWLEMPGNVGFGRGHNAVLDRAGLYHLVLNPDVAIDPDAVSEAIRFLDANPDCGLLVPDVFQEGQRQYLCKRFPAVFDLLLRGFAPAAVRALFARRLAAYEMRDVINGRDVVWNPPLVSGCFMFFRSAVLRAAGGFDDDFFLYFEDFDLSLRLAPLTRVAHVPSVRIAHYGGNAARKGWLHTRLFLQSAFTFYRRHGWRWI